MRSTRGSSWQGGCGTSQGAWERPQQWRRLEALYVPALGVGSLNTAAATLTDVARRRGATAVGTLGYLRTPLGPAISLLGSGARFVANNTADKYNFVHQTARFSILVVLKLSVVGVTHVLLDNTLSQSANTGFSLSIDGAARPALLVTRGVNGSPVVTLTATTGLAGNTFYVLAATCDGATARLFIDGRQEPTTAAVATLATGNASFRLNVGGRDDGLSAMRGNLLMAGLWSRCLETSEVRQLANDPYALLRRRTTPTGVRTMKTVAGRLAAATTFVAGSQAGLAHRAGAIAGQTVR
jgi:hypothetical protein